MTPSRNTKANPQKFLSADPNRAMQEMMDTIDTLRGVYIRETDALNNTDTKAFLELQEKKLDIARKYQMGIEDLLARKDQMKTVNPLLKNRLATMQKEFAELADRNMEALKRMQRCTERLGAVIMNAAKESASKQRAVAYGQCGTMKDRNEKKTVSMGISETA